jgi:hypothetical protein
MIRTNNVVASIAGILIVSLLFTVAFTPSVSASTSKTITILALLNGSPTAGATCTALTDGSPIAVHGTTDANGQVVLTVPSSATFGDITCTFGSAIGQQNNVQLVHKNTNVDIFMS